MDINNYREVISWSEFIVYSYFISRIERDLIGEAYVRISLIISATDFTFQRKDTDFLNLPIYT